MANPKGGKKWAKGVSGNPKGRPALPPEVREFKKLTIIELKEVCSMVMACSYEELQLMLTDEKASVIQRMAASLAINAIKKGNTFAWDALLNRLVGKPKETLKMEGEARPQTVHLIFEDNKRKVKEK